MSATPLPNRSKRCGEIRMNFDDMQLYCICDYCGVLCTDFLLFKHHIRMHCGERLPAGQDTVAVVDEPLPLTPSVEENVCPAIPKEKPISHEITTIREETTSELANLRTSTGSSTEESNEEAVERDQLLAFIQVFEKFPILWNPELWGGQNDAEKTAAIAEVVRTMQEKFGHTEWRTDLIENEVKNLFLLWFRLKKGIIEAPWFAKHLQFFETLSYESQINILRSIEVNVYKENEEEEIDDKGVTELPVSKSSGGELNVTRKLTQLTITFPQGETECAEDNQIKVDVITSVIRLSKCTTYQQIDMFIKLFQQKEMLWNVKHALYMNKYEAILACNQIANEMGRHFPGLQFSPKTMLKAARDLISLYNKMTGNAMQKLWFYEKLDFLNIQDEEQEGSHMSAENSESDSEGGKEDDQQMAEENQKETNAIEESTVLKKKPKTRKHTKTLKKRRPFEEPLSNLGTVRLIELFKRREMLWRKSHADYYNYGKRMQLYKEMAKTLNHELELSLTAKDVQNQMYSLVTKYRRRCLHADLRKLMKFLPRARRAIYNCQHCELQFVSRKKWIYHQYSHVHAKPRKQPKTTNLARAQRELSGSTKQRENVAKCFPCPHCEMCFATRPQLEVHRREHSGEKPHCCSECGMTFHKLSSKIKHHHGHAKLRTHFCTRCHESFYTAYHLNAHMLKHNAKHHHRVHQCGQCDKTFISKSCLKIHQKIHNTVWRYKLQRK